MRSGLVALAALLGGVVAGIVVDERKVLTFRPEMSLGEQ
jgi:hypothetical protein